MKMNNPNWGGRRPGAGRKPDPAEQRAQTAYLGGKAQRQLAKLTKWAAAQGLDVTWLQTVETTLAAWLDENVKEKNGTKI